MPTSAHRRRLRRALFVVATTVSAAPAFADPIKTVFVLSMENQNWEQPLNKFNGGQQQVFQNPASHFLNSLVGGTATATINGSSVNISSQTAYATAYHNVLSTPSGANPSIHPSEPNYIWSEAGSNRGVLNDNTPFQSPGGTNQNTSAHLSNLLTQAGKTWKSYQEDIDLAGSGSSKTSTVLPQSQWTVPLNNLSGTSASYTNPYNGAHQYDYAVKHNPMAFFTDTNGGNNTTPSNPLTPFYAPLQQLQTDLTNNTVADYNWITPNQFNDMHTALAGGFIYDGTAYTGDQARIAQGDNFLRIIVPQIMASQAYQDDGAIIIWWDESEPDGSATTNDFNHTIGELVISPDAHPNVNGLPYFNSINYTHSSDLLTMQEIFHVGPPGGLEDAANTTNLADLFAADVIPNGVPLPATSLLLLTGIGLMRLTRSSSAKA
jgi:phosphatidylinositol-3-phosphatase